MKTRPNDPIVPCKVYEESGSDVLGEVLVPKSGLSKREHYAGLAMQAQIAHYGAANPEVSAKMSVDAADALIEALNKTSTTN